MNNLDTPLPNPHKPPFGGQPKWYRAWMTWLYQHPQVSDEEAKQEYDRRKAEASAIVCAHVENM